MPNKEDSASRHRMVVEEIEVSDKAPQPEIQIPEKPIQTIKPEPDILEEGIKTASENTIQESLAKETPSSFIERPPEVKKPGSPVVWILIPGIFILGAILGGIVFYQKGVGNTNEPKNSPTPTASVSAVPTPSPTPKADVDVSTFDIAVYNGSGVAGEAGVVKELLEEAGFNVVTTGNAATYDYTKTIIKAKSEIEDSVIEKLEEALSENYVVGDSQTLSSSSTTDIQVVVGSSKAE